MKKIRVPTKINLGGYVVDVVYAPSVIVSTHAAESVDAAGSYAHDSISIALSSHSSKAEVMSTLFHECLHAALDRTGYNELLSATSPYLEEALVIMLEKHLAETFSFNKDTCSDWKYVEITGKPT